MSPASQALPSVPCPQSPEAAPSAGDCGLSKEDDITKRCQQRIQVLESKLVEQEEAHRQCNQQDQEEWDRAQKRLLDISAQLEEKLKSRTEELRRAGQKIIEAQRSLDQARTQLAERKKESAQLRGQLDQDLEQRREAEANEQERVRARMRRAIRESVDRRRNKLAVDILRRCLVDGGKEGERLAEQAEGGIESVLSVRDPQTADTAEDKSSILLEQLEQEFQGQIARQKESHKAALREFDARIEGKQHEYQRTCKQLRDLQHWRETKAKLLGKIC